MTNRNVSTVTMIVGVETIVATLWKFRGDLIAVFIPQAIEMFELDPSQMVWTKLESLHEHDAALFADKWGAIIMPSPEDSLCSRIYLPNFGFDDDGDAKVSAYITIGRFDTIIWIEPDFKH